jgi:signal transduction histidine kinase
MGAGMGLGTPGKINQTLGLQGQLVLGFVLVLIVVITGAAWLVRSFSERLLTSVQSEASVQIVQTVARTSETALINTNLDELTRIGTDLLKNRDVICVRFLDPHGEMLACSTRDEFPATDFPQNASSVESLSYLMQTRMRTSTTFGTYSEVTIPVIRLAGGSIEARDELAGYVSVGFTRDALNDYVASVSMKLLLLGAAIFCISLPVAWLLVGRLILPVRQLVAATKLLAIGNDDAHVESSRNDIVGTLARSFNHMATQVRTHKAELAEANTRLEEVNRGLETRIEKRTHQLQLANKRLREEVSEKESFVRTVSHDLNAPLRNIAGMASMLLLKYRNELNGDVIRRLERIKSNVAVQTELVNELLELSRIKTRRQSMEPVCIRSLIDEITDIFDNDLREKGIELVIETRLPVLQCERLRVRQVFQNLIDNAIKYSGGELLGRIGIGCRDHGDGNIEFWVSDTGAGIAPEEIDRIFHVFRRGSSSSGTCGKGVGLASVKSIIETYRGRIWVESTVSKGSTFKFTLESAYSWGKPRVAVA